MKKAQILLWWVCEDEPDRFSSLIMWFFKRPYSHCAFVHLNTGRLWHCTTPWGVISEDPEEAMIGCHVAAEKLIELNCSDEVLEAFLSGEWGKGYSMRGNIGLMIDRLPNFAQTIIRLFTKPFRVSEDRERNCSEFVGNVVHKYYQPLPGLKDKWTPPVLEELLKPNRTSK